MKEKFANWLRQPQTWGFFVSIAVMALISIAFFYPDNFDGRSLQQADMAQGLANGSEAKAYQEATGHKALWTNALFSGMPTFQIAPSYASNSLFSWVNRVYGLWLPVPSDLLFMMMLGFLILLYCLRVRWWVALIGSVAWAFSSYYIIIIGAGHLWKFITLTYIPPTIGGMVLCYRGRYWLGGGITAFFAMLQLNANHPQMTYYFCFVMAGISIACLAELVRSKRARQWAIGTCAVLAAGILAVGANLPSLYNTYKYAKETKRAQSELALDAAAADADADRPTGGMPKKDIVGWSYGRTELWSLLIPNIKGGASAKPVGGQMAFKSLAELEDARTAPYQDQQLLPYFSQYFNEGEGTNGPVYVGAIILALFLAGLVIVRGPLKWALLILTMLSMLLALGRNLSGLTDFMIYHFPLYNKFRAVESILVIAEFTIPLLATLALAKMLAPAGEQGFELAAPSAADERTSGDKSEAKTAQTALACSFGFLALACLVFAIWPSAAGKAITAGDLSVISQVQQYNPQFDPSSIMGTIERLRYGMVRADAMRSLLFLALSFVALAYYLHNKNKSAGQAARLAPFAALAVGALTLIDLYGADKRYVSHESFAFASAADLPAELKADDIDNCILQDKDLSYRVMDIPGFGLAARSYRHKMIGGYHAAKLGRYEDLINRRMSAVRGYGYIPELRDDSIAALLAQDQPQAVAELLADYRVLDMLNARYIITGDNEYPLVVNDNALGNAWLVGEINYVDNASEEMDALTTLDPSRQAVADKKFAQALGKDIPEPAPGDAIALKSYSPNELVYEADTRGGALAVFSEVYFPWGWKATVDGQKAELGRVNYILRALRLPAGKHQVVMTFDPDSIRRTVAIAYACAILIYLWLIAGIALCARAKAKE